MIHLSFRCFKISLKALGRSNQGVAKVTCLALATVWCSTALAADVDAKTGEGGAAAYASSVSGLSGTPWSLEGSSLPVAKPATGGDDFLKKEEKRVEGLRIKDETVAATLQLYKAGDELLIKKVLSGIMKIVESPRDGVAKVHTAALLLKRLFEIHHSAAFPIGSEKKALELKGLAQSVQTELGALESRAIFPIRAGELEVQLLILEKGGALPTEKIDPRIIQLLRDYYIKGQGYLSAYGFRMGMILDVGGHVGKMVDATGKKWLAILPTASFAIETPTIAFGHFKGATSLKSSFMQFSSGRFGLPPDTFLAGDSSSKTTYPGNEVDLKEKVVTLGVRVASTGWTRPFRVVPLPGRDYAYLIERLDLGAGVILK